jgi:hypothetical protein
MKSLALVTVFAFAVGVAAGWSAHDQPLAAQAGDVIVVQHPHQNPYGVGSKYTRVKLYSAGDDSFDPIPPDTTNATHWIVTINGVSYHGVAQD